MSNDKTPLAGADRRPVKVIVEQPEDAARNQAAKVEVVALAIDENFDAGGDPYNRTGQFMALKVDQGES
ncbi:MAG: hypothetical protein AAFX56_06900 [Pseudomonadota bacterium]